MPRPLEGHNSAPDLFPGLGLGAPRVLLVKPWLCILQDYGDDYHNVDNDDDDYDDYDDDYDDYADYDDEYDD